MLDLYVSLCQQETIHVVIDTVTHVGPLCFPVSVKTMHVVIDTVTHVGPICFPVSVKNNTLLLTY